MDEANPRFSGSDHLLRHALDSCFAHGAESRLIRLSELKFRGATPGKMVISWPTAPGKYALETSNSLVARALWALVTQTPQIIDSENRVTLDATLSLQYYRLRNKLR